MKILIKVMKSGEKCFLVYLENKNLIKEIKTLIHSSEHSKAIDSALSKGRIIKEVENEEIGNIDADLILAEKSVHYDLM